MLVTMLPAEVTLVWRATWSQSHLPLKTISSSVPFIQSPLPIFLAHGSTGKGDWVWLGGFQPPGSPEPSAGWIWVTGEPFSYSNWDSGQPSDTEGNPGGYHQDLLLMWYQGFWNDATGGPGGGPNSGYIVEYEVIPEPTIWGLMWVGAFAFVAVRTNRAK